MRLQEKVQAAQEQLTPLQESVRDSFTQVAQVGFCESLDLLSPQKIGPVFYFSLSLLFLKPLHLSALSGSAETERASGGGEVSNCPTQLEESPGGQLSCHGQRISRPHCRAAPGGHLPAGPLPGGPA